MRVVHMDSGLGNQMLDYAEYMAICQENPEEDCYIENLIYELPQKAGMFSIWNGYELERIFGINPPNVKQLFDEDAWKRILKDVEKSEFWKENWNYAPYITDALKKEGIVLTNLRKASEIKSKQNRTAKEKARELLKIVDLEAKADAYPAQLSGGQKQRVAIARSLAMNPKILLCDEATSALDPTTTRSILALLKDINQKFGITIVIITHEMGVVQEICSHVAIIDNGELAETGTVEEVFSAPKSRAARKLVFQGERKYSLMKSKRCIRIAFTENSSFEPVIANMVLECKASVNILMADTQDVGGIARGQMVLQLPEDMQIAEKMIQYLKDRNLTVEELDDYVE